VPRAVVCSDQTLVADSVRAALNSSGIVTSRVGWPDAELGHGGAAGWSQRVREEAGEVDVGVALCDLDRVDRLVGTRVVVRHTTVPWVVLTGAAEGALWGAVIERGATIVLPSSTSLMQLAHVVHEVAAGATVLDPAGAASLVDAWRADHHELASLLRRIESLSPREGRVLRLLYGGGRVRDIAEELGVSEATVRSQVRGVLRKLGVGSQLAAVALYAWADRGGVGGPLPNIEESDRRGPGAVSAEHEPLTNESSPRGRRS
jgi:DNA-binding NarL/FixJ family response regulator